MQDWTREQVVYGLRKWNRDNPDRRPTPGHILRVLKATRGQRAAERARASVAEVAEVARALPTDEERAAIMAEIGFKPRAFPTAAKEAGQ